MSGEAYMADKGLQAIREKLGRRRRQVAAEVAKLVKHAASQPTWVAGDLADQSSRLLEGEIAGTLVEAGVRELHQIDEALERLAKKSYGRCARCGGKIPVARLRVLPFALQCLKCQQEEEQTAEHSLELQSRRGARIGLFGATADQAE